MNFKKHTVLCAVLCTIASCKSRGFTDYESFKIKSTDRSLALDLMDVSILYPPAGAGLTEYSAINSALLGASINFYSSSEPAFPFDKSMPVGEVVKQLASQGFWPRLVEEPSEGEKGFISLNDFEKIIRVAPATSVETGKSLFGISSLVEKWQFNEKDNPYLRILPTPNSARDPLFGASSAKVPEDFLLVEANMAEAKRWRVVSVRFDPCPHLMLDKSEAAFIAAAKSGRCKPELRLVAQPALGGLGSLEGLMARFLPTTDRMVKFGSAISPIEDNGKNYGWGFADYAIHLFFQLNDTQASNIAKGLREIKQSNQNLCPTAGKYLGVHPCFIRAMIGNQQTNPLKFGDKFLSNVEVLEGNSALSADYLPLHNAINRGDAAVAQSVMNKWKNIKFAQEIRNLIQGQALKANRVAFFISTRGIGPWMFFQLARGKDNQLIQTPIVTLKSDETKENSKEEVKNLNARMTQLFTRSSGFNDEKVSVNISRSRIVPLPKDKHDSLEVFLKTPSGFQTQEVYEKLAKASSPGLENIKVTGMRSVDLSAVVNRITNPYLNSEFTVDCVSCHSANPEALVNAKNVAEQLKLKKTREDYNPFSFGEDESDDQKIIDKLERFNFLNKETTRHIFEPISKHLSTASEFIMNLPPGIAGRSARAHMGAEPIFMLGEAFDVYIFNQFSIFAARPIVSQRVVNESTLAAYAANQIYFPEESQNLTSCDKVRLQICSQYIGSIGARKDDRGAIDWGANDMYQDVCTKPEMQICK